MERIPILTNQHQNTDNSRQTYRDLVILRVTEYFDRADKEELWGKVEMELTFSKGNCEGFAHVLRVTEKLKK